MRVAAVGLTLAAIALRGVVLADSDSASPARPPGLERPPPVAPPPGPAPSPGSPSPESSTPLLQIVPDPETHDLPPQEMLRRVREARIALALGERDKALEM